MPDHHTHNLRRQLGLKEVPTYWKRDYFDYDHTHNACTCLTSQNCPEECEMCDPGPQIGLSTRVHTHTHTHIYKDPVLASSYIHLVTVRTSEGSQPVLSFGSLQLQVTDFKSFI